MVIKHSLLGAGVLCCLFLGIGCASRDVAPPVDTQKKVDILCKKLEEISDKKCNSANWLDQEQEDWFHPTKLASSLSTAKNDELRQSATKKLINIVVRSKCRALRMAALHAIVRLSDQREILKALKSVQNKNQGTNSTNKTLLQLRVFMIVYRLMEPGVADLPGSEFLDVIKPMVYHEDRFLRNEVASRLLKLPETKEDLSSYFEKALKDSEKRGTTPWAISCLCNFGSGAVLVPIDTVLLSDKKTQLDIKLAKSIALGVSQLLLKTDEERAQVQRILNEVANRSAGNKEINDSLEMAKENLAQWPFKSDAKAELQSELMANDLSINNGFQKHHFLQLEKEKFYIISLKEHDPSFSVRLDGIEGETMSYDNLAFYKTPYVTSSRVYLVPDETKLFRIIVSSAPTGGTGRYRLEVEKFNIKLKVESALTAGSETDSIRKDSYQNVHEFNVDEPGNYQIILRGGFDTYLRLEKPGDDSFQAIENDDSNNLLNNSEINENLEEGRYRIVVTSYRAYETGTYNVLVTLRKGEE